MGDTAEAHIRNTPHLNRHDQHSCRRKVKGSDWEVICSKCHNGSEQGKRSQSPEPLLFVFVTSQERLTWLTVVV